MKLEHINQCLNQLDSSEQRQTNSTKTTVSLLTFLPGDSQKSFHFCVTKIQEGYANELGSLTSPDLQYTRSSPKEAETTSTIGKNNSFRVYFEALHMQYAPDYIICIFSHMHLLPCEDLTEHHYPADPVIKVTS